MAYLIVVLLAALAGSTAYAVTLKMGRNDPVAVGFDGGSRSEADGEGDVGPDDGPGSGYTYLRVATLRPTWRDRTQGVVELLALLFVASAALAFGIYQLAHLINVTIERFLAQ
jgi:hypothetical protein